MLFNNKPKKIYDWLDLSSVNPYIVFRAANHGRRPLISTRRLLFGCHCWISPCRHYNFLGQKRVIFFLFFLLSVPIFYKILCCTWHYNFTNCIPKVSKHNKHKIPYLIENPTQTSLSLSIFHIISQIPQSTKKTKKS